MVRHALKNALIPIVTRRLAYQFGGLLSGAFLTETVFGRPGLGRYVVAAIGARDFPAIQGTVLVVAVVFVFINLLVDIAYAPSIRVCTMPEANGRGRWNGRRWLNLVSRAKSR